MTSTDTKLQQGIAEAERAIAAAKHVLALVGAGMSVESGIPPFRGPGGLWNRYGEPPMSGYEEFLADPAGWWQALLEPSGFRAELNEALERAEPNPGHYALAEMERAGLLKYIITQNVDGLHHRAGSENVAEIHGNITWLRCVDCGSRYERAAIPVDPADLPPRCPRCTGLIKTDGVMFGEAIPADVAITCQEQAERCDCMLLLGTSAGVYPAAGFAYDVLRRGGTLIEINPEETEISDFCQVVIRATTANALPALASAVKAG